MKHIKAHNIGFLTEKWDVKHISEESNYDRWKTTPDEPIRIPSPRISDPEKLRGEYMKPEPSPASRPQISVEDTEGETLDGDRYNSIVIYTGKNKNALKQAADKFKDAEFGAKNVADIQFSHDGDMWTMKLYVVDMHKHGFWKPWKDS